ncbi:MAG: hypothetical protein Q7T17_01210 [Microbacterium sp.]|uniref:hypothetical protein n=1 Tax=Microbacterium sp. TaxID=51671 RepID=UPI00271FF415|nr:hypothetical protein [Microbacterium sp.]MDO8381592.1 hypothetical protein [Microbacterium sp.]
MSMSEPFMPADEPRPERPPTDRDIDSDVDVIRDIGDGDSETNAPAGFPANTFFHTPTPGDRLTEDALEKDLDEE